MLCVAHSEILILYAPLPPSPYELYELLGVFFFFSFFFVFLVFLACPGIHKIAVAILPSFVV